MPPSTARSDTRGRPPFGFGRARGSNGATRAHKSSGTWTLMDPQHRTASQVLLGALRADGFRPPGSTEVPSHETVLRHTGGYPGASRGCGSLWRPASFGPEPAGGRFDRSGDSDGGSG